MTRAWAHLPPAPPHLGQMAERVTTAEWSMLLPSRRPTSIRGHVFTGHNACGPDTKPLSVFKRNFRLVHVGCVTCSVHVHGNEHCTQWEPHPCVSQGHRTLPKSPGIVSLHNVCVLRLRVSLPAMETAWQVETQWMTHPT